jgi:hypothetical protein
VIVALEQLAGLGIRDRLVRYATWVGTSVSAAVLAAGRAGLGLIPYVLLSMFAVWRLTEPR